MTKYITWFEFHLANKGYNFKEKDTGKIFTKLELYAEYRRNPHILQRLTDNTYPLYCHIDKEGWKDVKLIPEKKFYE